MREHARGPRPRDQNEGDRGDRDHQSARASGPKCLLRAHVRASGCAYARGYVDARVRAYGFLLRECVRDCGGAYVHGHVRAGVRETLPCLLPPLQRRSRPHLG